MSEWYYARHGQQYGPFSEEELINLIRSDAVKESDFLWTPGMENWARASSIPRIYQHFETPGTFGQVEPSGFTGASAQLGAPQYAGFWLRLAAYIIDSLVLGAAGCVIGFIIGIFSVATGDVDPEVSATAESVTNVIAAVMAWLYFALMESSTWQATLGKKALGIKVIDYQGNRISFLRATGRHFAKFISAIILFIGYIMAGFTERKQALHDMIAGTLVIMRR